MKMSTKKRNLVFSVILFAIILLSFSFVYASAGFGGSLFAGKISETTAPEIEEKENNGFDCMVDGTTIKIDNPIRGPETYIIPSGTKSKTGKEVQNGSWIMGKYSGTTTIYCEKFDPETETVITETVDLNEITFFGNS